MADVFRSELVKSEGVRNVPGIVGFLLGGEGDVLHLASIVYKSG